MTNSGTILVGHDGSTSSLDALRWALTWAGKTDSSVTLVRGWSISSAPRPATWERGYAPPLSDFADAVLAKLEQDTTEIRSEFPDVAVQFQAPHAPAANALIEASADADLLVVGARGLGGFKGLLLGSVSEQCVRHSQCPVVVVRGEGSGQTGRSATPDENLQD